MLKDDFNLECQNECLKKGTIPKQEGEVFLFENLKKVLNSKAYAVVDQYHGRKGLVKHNLVYPHNGNHERRCEISDLLLLFFYGNKLRYTFLQNKRMKYPEIQTSVPLLKFYADIVQWDLLHYRCWLTDVETTKLPQDCLSSAVLDGATSYGVFINDKSINTVDMVYYIAKDLYPMNSSLPIPAKSKTLQFYTDPTNLHIYKSSGGLEVSGIRTLNEFELFSRLFLVGSPVDLDKQKYLAKILLSSAKKIIKDSIDSPNRRYQHELRGEEIAKRQDFLHMIDEFSRNYDLSLDDKFAENISRNIAVVKSESNIVYLCNEGKTASKVFKEFAKHINVTDNINNPLIGSADLIIADEDFYEQNERMINNKILNKEIYKISFEYFINLI